MVPSDIEILDGLAAHRQWQDRQALAARPDRPTPPRPTAGREPGTSDRFGVWQEVLGVTEVGVDDNFFDLGGRSLLLVRVQARLAQVPQPGNLHA